MAILATEKVLTLDYWKPAEKIQVGDYVFNQTGDLVKVTLVQKYRAENCYQVTFNDHLTVSGDEKLNFPFENHKYRCRVSLYKGRFKFRRPLGDITVEKLKDRPLKKVPGIRLISVPTAHPLKLPHQTLPIPPFVFGYWFFNRKLHNKMIFSKNRQEEITQRFKDCGYKVIVGHKTPNNERYFTVSPSIELQLAPNVPTRIPNNYLLASEEQRIELLQGILAAKSRQYSREKNIFRVSNKNLRLLVQVQSIIESLGSKTTLEHNQRCTNYILFFKSKLDLVPNQDLSKTKIQLGRRYPKLIEPLNPQSCVYIETEGKFNHILVGEGFIPCR